MEFKTQQVVVNSRESDINLILDNIKSKITHIKTSYRLAERVLTPKFKEEYLKRYA
jgi:uncharacterized protein YukE